jgi:hypothetical protein
MILSTSSIPIGSYAGLAVTPAMGIIALAKIFLRALNEHMILIGTAYGSLTTSVSIPID